MQEVKKVWGKEIWIKNDEKYCMKEMTLNKGYQCSLHCHKVKTETFYIAKGKVNLQIEEKELKDNILYFGDYYHINPGVYHRFIGLEDSIIIECSTKHSDDDSYRKKLSGKVKFD